MSDQLSNASPPWSGDPADDEGRERSRRVRRALEHAVVVILALIAVMIIVGSLPVWLGAIRGHRAVAANRGIERVTRQHGWAVGEPRKRAPSRYAPRPEAFHSPSVSLLEELLGHEDIGQMSGEGRPAVSRGKVDMLDRADDEGEVVMELNPSMTMLVAKDLGRWLLVAVRKAERTQYGWVRRRDVVILP